MPSQSPDASLSPVSPVRQQQTLCPTPWLHMKVKSVLLVQRIVETRMAHSGGSMPHVNVTSHGRQQHAAWCAPACSPASLMIRFEPT